MTWPPKVGEPLPRATEVIGIRAKLADYSLNLNHTDGGPKARGFKLILGITLVDLEHLARSIEFEVPTAPIESVRPNPPHGVNCIVVVPVQGLGEKSARIVNVRTAWEIADHGAPPRLVSAFPRP
jgi:hypothetical protein